MCAFPGFLVGCCVRLKSLGVEPQCEPHGVDCRKAVWAVCRLASFRTILVLPEPG